MVSLCSSCQNASPDMQHDLLGSTRDLTRDLGLMLNFDLTFQRHQVHFLSRLDERNRMLLEWRITFLVQKLFTKKLSLPKKAIMVFLDTWRQNRCQLKSEGMFMKEHLKSYRMLFPRLLPKISYGFFAKLDIWWPLVTSISSIAKYWRNYFAHDFWWAFERTFFASRYDAKEAS